MSRKHTSGWKWCEEVRRRVDDPKSVGDQLGRSAEQSLEWKPKGQNRFQRIECKAIEGAIYQKTRDEGRKGLDWGGGCVCWWVSDEREGMGESALVEDQRKPRLSIVSGVQFLKKNAAHSAYRLF
jgi:hypothetical protein